MEALLKCAALQYNLKAILNHIGNSTALKLEINLCNAHKKSNSIGQARTGYKNAGLQSYRTQVAGISLLYC